LLVLGFGNPALLLMVGFVPGYLTVAVLFPEEGKIDWLERIVLSAGTSLAVVSLVGIGLNFTPWGITISSLTTTLTGFATIVGAAAYWRRARLPPVDRLAGALEFRLSTVMGRTASERAVTLGLVATTVVALLVMGFVARSYGPQPRFTEFYVLGPRGTAAGYPALLNRSEPTNISVGLINHESVSEDYLVRIELVALSVAYNATCACNQTSESNRTFLTSLNVTLRDGQSWTRQYLLVIDSTGLWKVELTLYMGGLRTDQLLFFDVRVE